MSTERVPATIKFHNDELLVVAIDGKPHIVLRPAFAAIGLADPGMQIKRLREQPWATVSSTVVTTIGAGQDGSHRMVTSDLRTFLMHLATIPATRVAEHARLKLVEYQCEVAQVIEDHFTKRLLIPVEPTTWTWDEVAAIIRQRYGHRFTEVDITRGLRAAGVLKLSRSGPRAEYRDWLWFTGSAWTVHPHVVPELLEKLLGARRALADAQSQLQLNLPTAEQLRGLKGGTS